MGTGRAVFLGVILSLVVNVSSSFAARHAVIGPDGDVYVRRYIPDPFTGLEQSVARYDGTTGDFIEDIVTAEMILDAGLFDIEFILFSPGGSLYVGNAYDGIHRFTGSALEPIVDLSSTSNYQFYDVFMSADSLLYFAGTVFGATEYRAVLLQYDADGTPMGDLLEGGSHSLESLYAVADAPNGNLYIGCYSLDEFNYKIYELDPSTGQLVRDLFPDEFLGLPTVLLPVPGNVLIVDMYRAYVERFSTDTGASLGTIIDYDRYPEGGISGMMLDGAGNLLIATLDVMNYIDVLIHRYNPVTGDYIDLFIQPPPVIPDDNFYISDTETFTVFRYERDTGTLLNEFAYTTAEEIAFGPDGNLYGSARTEVSRFHGETGAYIGALVYTGLGGLEDPAGFAFSPDGASVLVSDRTGEAIRRYDSDTGEFIEDLVPFVSTPGLIAFNPDGDLAVISGPAILLFDGTTGDSKPYVGTGGGLTSPKSLTFGPGDNLYVSNITSNQVLRYNGTTGAFVDVFIDGGPLIKPRDCTFGPDGDFFVTSDIDLFGFEESQILRYSPSGDFRGVYVAVDAGYMQRAEAIIFGPGEPTPGGPTPTPGPTDTPGPTPTVTPTPTLPPGFLTRWEVLFDESLGWMDTFDRPALTGLLQEWIYATPPVPTPTPTPPSGSFALWEHLQFAPGNTWYYVGYDLGTGVTTNEDNFRWTVEDSFQDVGGGRMAHRVRTDTDEPTDDRNGDVDFWFHDTNGDVYFYGLFKAQISDVGFGVTIPSQNIIFSDPVLVGGDNMTIGVPVTDTGEGSVTLTGTISGTYTGLIESTLTPVEFRPSLQTPLGTFTNVLVLILNIDVTVDLGGFIGEQTFSIQNAAVFLKNGAGIIAHNQTADPNDAQVQAISEGTVGGEPVTAN